MSHTVIKCAEPNNSRVSGRRQDRSMSLLKICVIDEVICVWLKSVARYTCMPKCA